MEAHPDCRSAIENRSGLGVWKLQARNRREHLLALGHTSHEHLFVLEPAMTTEETQNPTPTDPPAATEPATLVLEERPEDPVGIAQWRIRMWWPRDLPRSIEEPEVVAFTRKVVATGAPRTPNEASMALGYCYR
jgi:hypothetical protein